MYSYLNIHPHNESIRRKERKISIISEKDIKSV